MSSPRYSVVVVGTRLNDGLSLRNFLSKAGLRRVRPTVFKPLPATRHAESWRQTPLACAGNRCEPPPAPGFLSGDAHRHETFGRSATAPVRRVREGWNGQTLIPQVV